MVEGLLFERLVEARELEYAKGQKSGVRGCTIFCTSKKGKAMQTAEMARSETFVRVWDEEVLSTVDTRTERPRTALEVWVVIRGLDMGPIRMKLADPEEGAGWTEQDLDEAERWYKRYLFLHFKYPTKRIVPTKTIDTFWHQHILDTRKYSRDCQKVFGFFLHHFPYFGMRGEEDAANLKRAFEETLRLFESEFGESPVGMRLSSHCRGGGNCDRGCTRCD